MLSRCSKINDVFTSEGDTSNTANERSVTQHDPFTRIQKKNQQNKDTLNSNKYRGKDLCRC